MLGFFRGFRLVHLCLEDDGDLLVQIVHHILNEHGQIVPGIVDAVGLVPGRAGVDDAHELSDHIDDDGFVRVLEQVHFINITAVAVILQNAVHDAFDLLFNGGHRSSLLA